MPDLPSSIFLIGPRGSGKSSVAPLVADALGWPWIDADDVVEQHAGRTIREIFSSVGEAGFRERESAVLAELCQLKRHVVATGGGVVVAEKNRQMLRCAGRVVWLTADYASLWDRLRADEATAERRPALAGGGSDEVAGIVRLREPYYRACAHFTIDTAGRTLAQVAAEILGQLER
jgi:shikimate kinase